MGRPILKKYFGNTNATGGPGEGVASYGTIVAGSGWTAAPTVTVSGPTSPTGVIATVAAHYSALSASVVAAGTGYDWHDVLTVTTGTGTKPQFQVSGITVVSVTVAAGGTGYTNGNTITISTGMATNIILTVTNASAGVIQAGGVSITQAGLRNASAKPANPVAQNSTSGGGSGATFNLTWGVSTLTASPTVAGDMTAFSSAGSATTASPAGGTGATLTVTYGLLSVAVLTAGSGYYSAADAAITFSGSTGASTTAVLTGTNQNAVLTTAYIPAVNGGLSAKDGDIVKQESATRYLVRTADGTGQCKLVAAAPAAGEMTLKATDSAGGTYYVTKLTAHKARIVKGDRTGTQFTTGSTGVMVGWSLTSATANVSVVIENA